MTGVSARGRTAVRLAETVSAVWFDDGVRLIRGGQSLRVRGDVSFLRRVVDLLHTGLPAERYAATSRTVGQLAGRLEALGWLVEHDAEFGQGTALERQIGYLTLFGTDAARMQRNVGAARIAVLGLGAVGGVISQHLVGAGVRELTLIDFDQVALHNLNRQFLSGRPDIGDFKTRVAARALTRLDPDVRLTEVTARVGCTADLASALPEPVDLLVVCADTPPDIAAIAWDWARPRDTAVCTVAVGLGTGYWGPVLVPRLGHCWTCFEDGRRASLPPGQSDVEDSCAEPTPYSFGPSNTVISALCAHELVRYLATGDCAVLNRRGHLRFADHRTSFLEGPACEHQGGPGAGPP